MNIEQYCVSLELARELRDNGYPQESCFYWVKGSPWGAPEKEPYYLSYKDSLDFRDKKKLIAAPLSSEIGELLPLYLKVDADRGISFSVEACGLWVHKNYDNKGWTAGYSGRNRSSDTLANTFAKLWLYLKKEGLL